MNDPTRTIAAKNTTIKLYDKEFKSTGTVPSPFEKVYRIPAYSLVFMNIIRGANDAFNIDINGKQYEYSTLIPNNGLGSAIQLGNTINFSDRMFMCFKYERKSYNSREEKWITDGYDEKWIFALPGEDCTIEIYTWSETN